MLEQTEGIQVVVFKKVVVGVIAAVLLVAGGACGAAALWAYDTFGSNGVMRFDAGTITPGPLARATIVDIDRFGATVPYIGQYGRTTLSVSSGERGDPSDTLFIGAAATSAVDEYLRSTPYAVGIRDGDAWITRDVPGVRVPELPREQEFWLAEAVGARPAIAMPAERPLTVVLMHPATVPTGPVTLSIDFTLPDASTWILGLAIAAAVLVLLSLLLFVLLFRMRRRPGRHQVGARGGSHAAHG
ncbi:MAG: hypothetical protein IPO93_11810 [Actinobacteria bacterium]|nr:hypothetical protein [Actinomycetota bacterium]